MDTNLSLVVSEPFPSNEGRYITIGVSGSLQEIFRSFRTFSF